METFYRKALEDLNTRHDGASILKNFVILSQEQSCPIIIFQHRLEEKAQAMAAGMVLMSIKMQEWHVLFRKNIKVK